MTKKLSSLLEMAIVIGGLIAAPIVVLASFETVAAVVPTDRAAVTMGQDFSTAGVRIAGLKF
jgi:hypothetical protein